MTLLRTDRLILRNWEDRDRALFHRINSDPEVMRFFPFRRDRAAADAKMDELAAAYLHRGFGFGAVEVAETGACIGFTGLSPVSGIPGLPSDAVEIGWRLVPEAWGKGFATEAARGWLGFGFEQRALPEVVSFAVIDNHASIAVMQRLGMRHEGDFDYDAVPADQPHLRRHALYRLARQDWK